VNQSSQQRDRAPGERSVNSTVATSCGWVALAAAVQDVAEVLLTRSLSNPPSEGNAFVNKLNRLGSERERSLLSPQSLVPPVGFEPTLSAF
jgi:hypothetical protein